MTEAERQYLAAHPVIRVSNELDFPPFDFVQGAEPQGYSIDLIRLLAGRIGVEVQFVNGYSWSELVELFKLGELDLLHTLSRTDEREEFGLFSAPFRRYKNYFITHIDQSEIRSIDQLAGKTVAVGRDWSNHTYLSENHPEINLLVLDNQQEILEAVDDQRAVAAISSKPLFSYYTRKFGITDLKLSGWFKEFDRGAARTYRFLAQKSDPELVSLLNKALDSLTITDLEYLNTQWFGNTDLSGSGIAQPQFTAEELSYLDLKGPIQMCVDPAWLPFERLTEAGEHEGMAADILGLVQKRAHIDLQPVVTESWTESIDFARERRCDIFSLAMETAERSEYMSFTRPYVSFPFVIATRDEELFVERLDQVIDKPMAIVSGYAYTELLKAAYPQIKLTEVENVTSGLQAVVDRSVYGMIGALPTIAYGIRSGGFTSLKIAGKFDESWDLSVAARNDQPILLSIMEKALQTVSEQEKAEIYNRWYAIRLESGPDYALVARIVATGLVIFALFILWNRQIARARKDTEHALSELQKVYSELEDKNAELEELSVKDHLTGVFNRVKLDEILNIELSRARRYHHSLGVLMIDVDHFKRVNDKYGHQTGDRVLMMIAKTLSDHTRRVDTLGRWGGEEFLIICPETELEGLLQHANQLRQQVDQKVFEVENQTISIGLSLLGENDSIESVIAKADEALYRAKARGRNRVEYQL